MTAQKILIIDDDEITSEAMAAALRTHYDVALAHCGNTGLGAAFSESPALILLDIGMEGMDGFEVCRTLRAASQVPIIFVSSHDALAERIRAFECGGDDFIVKPCPPELLQLKIGRMLDLIRERDQLANERTSLQNLTMTAMQEMGWAGQVLNFVRDSLDLVHPMDLANRVMDVASAHGVTCHVQTRYGDDVQSFTPRGRATPLEASVISGSLEMGRVFHFSSRMIINFEHVSVLVQGMPEDVDAAGRIRDNMAILAESANALMGVVMLRRESAERAEVLQAASMNAFDAIERLREVYRGQRGDTRMCLENMVTQVEHTYVHLGLSTDQEGTISDTMRDGAEEVLRLFERAVQFDEEFDALLSSLKPQAEDTNEVWL